MCTPDWDARWSGILRRDMPCCWALEARWNAALERVASVDTASSASRAARDCWPASCSRSVTVQATATHGTVEQMVAAFSAFLEEGLGAAEPQFFGIGDDYNQIARRLA